MVCRFGGAKSKETRYSMLKGGLVGSYNYNSPTFANRHLHLQIQFRTVSCRILPNLTLTYLVSLLFAPPILHITNHFLAREVFDLLV